MFGGTRPEISRDRGWVYQNIQNENSGSEVSILEYWVRKPSNLIATRRYKAKTQRPKVANGERVVNIWTAMVSATYIIYPTALGIF